MTDAHIQSVQGGLAIYGKDEVDSVLNATAKFDAENTDPKAQLITTLEGSELGTRALVLFFYDGPDRPESFSHFDDIDSVLDLTKTQTFADFVKGFPSNLITNARGTFHTLSTSELTPKFLAAVKNETDVCFTLLDLAASRLTNQFNSRVLAAFQQAIVDIVSATTLSPS